MKAKELKALLDKLDDEQEIVLASVWSDDYGKGAELNGQITLFITEEGPVALLLDYQSLITELRKYGINGHSLQELENFDRIVRANQKWLKLLEEENDDDKTGTGQGP